LTRAPREACPNWIGATFTRTGNPVTRRRCAVVSLLSLERRLWSLPRGAVGGLEMHRRVRSRVALLSDAGGIAPAHSVGPTHSGIAGLRGNAALRTTRLGPTPPQTLPLRSPKAPSPRVHPALPDSVARTCRPHAPARTAASGRRHRPQPGELVNRPRQVRSSRLPRPMSRTSRRATPTTGALTIESPREQPAIRKRALMPPAAGRVLWSIWAWRADARS